MSKSVFQKLLIDRYIPMLYFWLLKEEDVSFAKSIFWACRNNRPVTPIKYACSSYNSKIFFQWRTEGGV